MRYKFLLFAALLFLSPQLLATEFPTGVLEGIGFVVEKGNQKFTEKDLYGYNSSATVIKQLDDRYQFTIVANMQRTPSTPVKIDKRVDTYHVKWESSTSGRLINSKSEFKDDKSSFTISDGKLVIRSWIARNQLWETHTYSLSE